jgi:MGT family glycosyltransferase
MKQLHFLMTLVEGGGNVPPQFDLAQSLMARGHRLTILSEPCLKQAAEDIGAGFIPFTEHFTRTDRKEDFLADFDASKFNNPIFDKVMLGPAKILVHETLRAAKAHDIDALLVDILIFPARIAAEHLNIPSVVVFHMPEFLPGRNRPPGNLGLLPGKGPLGRLRDRVLGKLVLAKLNKYKPLLNEIRHSLHLEDLTNTTDLIHQADLRLIQTLKSFDIPLEPAPANVRYTGPSLADPDWAAPTWENPWPGDDERPLVVISFSSTFQDQMGVIQNSIDALQDLPVRGLVTLGLAIEDEQFSLPDNVKVANSVPHSAIFPLASLVITHAGHGTIMKALAHGLPLIALPMGRDQDDNAAKVALHGCGIQLKRNASPGRIKAAVKEVLTKPSFKAKAALFAGELASASTKELAIHEIEKLVVKAHSQTETPAKA